MLTSVGRGVAVGVFVGESFVGVRVGVAAVVAVGIGVAVGVAVGIDVAVGVAVGIDVAVGVAVGIGVAVGVTLAMLVSVTGGALAMGVSASVTVTVSISAAVVGVASCPSTGAASVGVLRGNAGAGRVGVVVGVGKVMVGARAVRAWPAPSKFRRVIRKTAASTPTMPSPSA